MFKPLLPRWVVDTFQHIWSHHLDPVNLFLFLPHFVYSPTGVTPRLLVLGWLHPRPILSSAGCKSWLRTRRCHNWKARAQSNAGDFLYIGSSKALSCDTDAEIHMRKHISKIVRKTETDTLHTIQIAKLSADFFLWGVFTVYSFISQLTGLDRVLFLRFRIFGYIFMCVCLLMSGLASRWHHRSHPWEADEMWPSNRWLAAEQSPAPAFRDTRSANARGVRRNHRFGQGERLESFV